ncbi:hypothetical protein E2C01_039107 [Portunus trituberculatus]|uniref:Uncharacterized protein n=1 Tax=Portunus trituberculatus TaxID=210409 RepID=A0A5B7FJS1_PORTR|nr:hypothetical protein [Portunus trituberculatus]
MHLGAFTTQKGREGTFWALIHHTASQASRAHQRPPDLTIVLQSSSQASRAHLSPPDLTTSLQSSLQASRAHHRLPELTIGLLRYSQASPRTSRPSRSVSARCLFLSG